MLVCVNVGDEILLGGGGGGGGGGRENVKPGKNSIFLKNGKTIIVVIVQVENMEFF